MSGPSLPPTIDRHLTFTSLLSPDADFATQDWRSFRPGVDIAVLYGVVGETRAAALLRYAPGASIPPHSHVGLEHLFVLRGSQQDERGVYHAGTMVVNPPGTSHRVQSPAGCIVLLLWDAPVRFLEP